MSKNRLVIVTGIVCLSNSMYGMHEERLVVSQQEAREQESDKQRLFCGGRLDRMQHMYPFAVGGHMPHSAYQMGGMPFGGAAPISVVFKNEVHQANDLQQVSNQQQAVEQLLRAVHEQRQVNEQQQDVYQRMMNDQRQINEQQQAVLQQMANELRQMHEQQMHAHHQMHAQQQADIQQLAEVRQQAEAQMRAAMQQQAEAQQHAQAQQEMHARQQAEVQQQLEAQQRAYAEQHAQAQQHAEQMNNAPASQEGVGLEQFLSWHKWKLFFGLWVAGYVAIYRRMIREEVSSKKIRELDYMQYVRAGKKWLARSYAHYFSRDKKRKKFVGMKVKS